MLLFQRFGIFYDPKHMKTKMQIILLLKFVDHTRRLRILTKFFELTDNVTSSRTLHLNVRQNILKRVFRKKINLKKGCFEPENVLHFHEIKNDHLCI